jgi:hypothetical protein
VRISDPYRIDAGLLGGIVVSAREQGVPDKNHLVNGNAENVSQLSDPVGLVNAGLGDVDGRRSPQAYGELGNQRVKRQMERQMGSKFVFSFIAPKKLKTNFDPEALTSVVGVPPGARRSCSGLLIRIYDGNVGVSQVPGEP